MVYVAREWKFEQTASLAIHNLKSPSYDKSLPPSGVKNEEGAMSEAKLNVAMYLWKKEMDIIYYAKKRIRPICTGSMEGPSDCAQKQSAQNLRSKIDIKISLHTETLLDSLK